MRDRSLIARQNNAFFITILREHIFRRRPQYHVWVWHGKEGVCKEKSVVEYVNNVNVSEDVVDHVDRYETDEENVDEDVDHVDVMMEGVMDELGKRPHVFYLFTEASQKPLYSGCTKFTKLTSVLIIFNIKSKFNWRDTSFTVVLEALGKMLPEGNELLKSTYYAKKLTCPFGLEY